MYVELWDVAAGSVNKSTQGWLTSNWLIWRENRSEMKEPHRMSNRSFTDDGRHYKAVVFHYKQEVYHVKQCIALKFISPSDIHDWFLDWDIVKWWNCSLCFEMVQFYIEDHITWDQVKTKMHPTLHDTI